MIHVGELKEELIQYAKEIGVDKIRFASADTFDSLKDRLILHESLGYLSGFEEPDIEIELDNSFEEAKQVTIEGSFAALVRDKMPNYVLDDTTPNTLVVTMFQDGPFVVSDMIGDLVEEVEVGKVYIFEIQPKVIGEFKESELNRRLLSPDIALRLYGLVIANIYEADDEETYSLHGAQLRYAIGE